MFFRDIFKATGICFLLLISLISLAGPANYCLADGRQYTAADYRKNLDFYNSIRDKAYNINPEFHWLKDDAGVWYEIRSENTRQFVLFNTTTSTEGELFDHAALAQTLAEASGQTLDPNDLPITRLQFDLEQNNISFDFDQNRWEYTISRNEITKLKPTQPQPQDQQRRHWRNGRNHNQHPTDRHISPDGKWKAFTKDYQLWLEDTASGEQIALTTDGTAQQQYSDDVHFSPDSLKLVCITVKPVEERQVHYIESSPADQLQPKHFTINYVKPGDEITTYYPTMFDLASRSQLPVSTELFANPYNIDDFHWLDDSSEFLFYFNQRGHQVNRVLAINSTDGTVRSVVEEKSETFIVYSSKKYLQYLDDSSELIWASERDGWNHLYLYDIKTGQVKNQVTSGNWVMRKVLWVDATNKQIYFTASGYYTDQDPYYIHYFRINFDGTNLKAFTTANGTHELFWSPGRNYYIDKWSRIDLPPVCELHKADTTPICTLTRGDVSAQFNAGWQAPEPFMAMSRDDKYEIWGVIYRPVNFNPSQKYPVIEDIYAGPHDNFVPKAWGGYAYWRQALAELGFIVVQIDGMGTSNRCRDFHHFACKNVADAGLPDRIKWIKAAAEKYPYMDIDNVGIFGTSAGGQSALGALLFHGDFYKAAVASCGCHDNRMDKIWWNEQWMGYPVDDSYTTNSNVVNAGKLQGKLLLIVGELDRNVDPASTMQVANALIKANKDFDLLVVPGMDHASGGKFGERKRRDFFIRHLRGDIPVDWNTVPAEQILP
ncbi:MAG: DPP IV N-terminal domain-containing protein [Sedimentisphaerales bacterium]|nr:DPP IV N-terminal domain-containing protein [Sedimentisphaerales bacterium]